VATAARGGPRPGWPPQFFYALEENSPRAETKTLVSAGGDRVSYSRVSISSVWGTCFDARLLTPDTRFHLLAEMLGLAPKEMPWQPRESTNFIWESNKQYLRDLRDVIAEYENRLHSTTVALQAKGLLSAEEAESARPQLDVEVSDSRGARYSPLPHLTLNEAHTSISYSKIDQDLSSVPAQR
jgi:hypothetical protein